MRSAQHRQPLQNATDLPSNGIYRQITLSSRPNTVGLSLYRCYETAPVLRLVFDLIGDLRLDGHAIETWPPLAILGDALRFTQAYGFTAVYKLLINLVKDTVTHGYHTRAPIDALHLAASLGDDILATSAVRALEMQAERAMRGSTWDESEFNSTECMLQGMGWVPGSWTLADFEALPSHYVWALMRSMVPRCIPHNEHGGKSYGASAAMTCADLFMRLLQHHRRQERI